MFQKFYEDIKDNLIIQTNKIINGDRIKNYIWDDYALLSDFIKKNDAEKISMFTVIKKDKEFIIVEGCRYSNRIGYLVSTKKFEDFPAEGIKIKRGDL